MQQVHPIPPAEVPEDSAIEEGVDPELLSLPAPPRGRRIATMGLMAMVIVASMALGVSLRHDLAYFLRASSEVTELGSINDLDPATLRTNTHVRIQGTPMISRAVHVRRVLTGGRTVVFPLAGQRTVYVQVDERPGALARSDFDGRLVTFNQMGGRMSNVRGYLNDEMDVPASGESFLLIADQPPESYAWSMLLLALCIAFVLINVVLLLRWFRRTPNLGDGPEEADALSS